MTKEANMFAEGHPARPVYAAGKPFTDAAANACRADGASARLLGAAEVARCCHLALDEACVAANAEGGDRGVGERARALADAVLSLSYEFSCVADEGGLRLDRQAMRTRDAAARVGETIPKSEFKAEDRRPRVVVTRHAALVAYLREQGYVVQGDPAYTHVVLDPDAPCPEGACRPEQIRGRHVIGVLPHHLSSLAASVTELKVDVPPELRGAELTLQQLRQYARGVRRYEVREVEAPAPVERIDGPSGGCAFCGYDHTGPWC